MSGASKLGRGLRGLIVLLLLRLLPESPRWLVRSGRMAQAEAAISRIEQEIRPIRGSQ